MKITFITGNAAKAKQLERYFNHPVKHKKLDLPEIQSLDLEEIIEKKIKEAYKIVKSLVIVEDVALRFKAINNLPGPLIKWFLNSLDNKGLCKLLDGYKTRAAEAEVCYGFYDGKVLKYFHGKVKGKIAPKPMGEKVFGWDPTFIPHGHTKTWAQMDKEEQKSCSMRRIALEKLDKFLKEEYLRD